MSKEIKVQRDIACSTCNGSGAKAGTKPETCTGCNGRGQVVHNQGFFMVQSTCPKCRGEGRVVKEPCADCNGRRTQIETSVLSVTVPPGVDEPDLYRQRSGSIILPRGADWLESTKHLRFPDVPIGAPAVPLESRA